MKNGKYAIYLGKEYSSGIDRDGNIILRSTDIIDTQNGFEPCDAFSYKGLDKDVVCVKYVTRSDIAEYYKIKTKAIYAGYEFEVVEVDGEKISIVTMTGDYNTWEKIGMNTIEKGVYQKWVCIDEVEIKVEKRLL